MRLESFRDNNGYIITAPLRNQVEKGNRGHWTSRFAGGFWELTLGLNHDPNENPVIRPELRDDRFSPNPSSTPLPYGRPLGRAIAAGAINTASFTPAVKSFFSFDPKGLIGDRLLRMIPVPSQRRQGFLQKRPPFNPQEIPAMSDATSKAAGAATAAIMKAEHERWLSGLAQWRNDIQRWQAEHRAAIARLAEVQHALEEHGRCLDDHAIEFGRIEEAVASHECLLDGEAGEPRMPPDEETIQRHRDQEGAFRRHENAHGRIAHHHDGVMECMRALEVAASAAM